MEKKINSNNLKKDQFNSNNVRNNDNNNVRNNDNDNNDIKLMNELGIRKCNINVELKKRSIDTNFRKLILEKQYFIKCKTLFKKFLFRYLVLCFLNEESLDVNILNSFRTKNMELQKNIIKVQKNVNDFNPYLN
jgi:hypothetical protein